MQPTRLFTARKRQDVTGSKPPRRVDGGPGTKPPASPELSSGTQAQGIAELPCVPRSLPSAKPKGTPVLKVLICARPAIEERAARIATSRREHCSRARTVLQTPQAVRSARGRGGRRIFPSAAGAGWTLQADKCHALGLTFNIH